MASKKKAAKKKQRDEVPLPSSSEELEVIVVPPHNARISARCLLLRLCPSRMSDSRLFYLAHDIQHPTRRGAHMPSAQ